MQRIFLNVGYELSEKQLRGYFVKFGVLSDLYLPKHANGRNKGYGFATFASPESLALALQHPKHIVDGITVQVKRAGPRPPDNSQDNKPAAAKVEHVPFGKGPRIYVGGVHECLTEARLREHFSKWGAISDIYFPGARNQKRANYCFVTFDNRRNAERACSESGRNLDGWSLESICMADDRKVDHSTLAALPAHTTAASTAVGHAAQVAGEPSYTLWLQLQYQQQLAALQSTVSAAAAHEASLLTQKAPSQGGSPATSFGAAPSLDIPLDPYSHSASLYNQIHDQGAGLTPQWWLPAPISSGGAVSAVLPDFQEALSGTRSSGASPSRNPTALLARQSMLYAAEQERQQQQVTARLQPLAAGVGMAEVGLTLGPPYLRAPGMGFGRGPAQFDGRSLAHSFPEAGFSLGGPAQEYPSYNFPPDGY